MRMTALEWKKGGQGLEVEQALHDALFAESSREDSGLIQFRFRLERKP
jgi:hypothetical protein